MTWHHKDWISSVHLIWAQSIDPGVLDGFIALRRTFFIVEANIAKTSRCNQWFISTKLIRNTRLEIFLSMGLRWAPDLELYKWNTWTFYLLNWLGIAGLLDLINIDLIAHRELEIVAEWHDHELIGHADCTSALIIGKHRENIEALLWLEMVEARIIDIAEYKVFRWCSHRVLSILLYIARNSRYSFTAVTSIDKARSWICGATNQCNHWGFVFNILPEVCKLSHLPLLSLAVC